MNETYEDLEEMFAQIHRELNELTVQEMVNALVAEFEAENQRRTGT